MKKIICVCMTAAMTMAVLAGCGPSPAAELQESAGKLQETPEAGTESQGNKQTERNEADSAANDSEISVISREDGSGTRGAFIELFGVEVKEENGEKTDRTTEEASITNSTSVMMTTVAGDENAVGYISLGSLNDTVKAVKIDGAEASVANINSGAYSISRPFNIAVKEKPSDAAQDFIDFIMSSGGQAVIEENGYIKAAESAAAYSSKQPVGKIVIAGSSSVSPVMEKLKEAYLEMNPNVSVEIQQSDSTTGLTSVMDRICDIGMASRELKDTEIAAGLKNTVIALDGIAVIVNQNNPVSDLTKEQVRKIFTGEALTWSDALK